MALPGIARRIPEGTWSTACSQATVGRQGGLTTGPRVDYSRGDRAPHVRRPSIDNDGARDHTPVAQRPRGRGIEIQVPGRVPVPGLSGCTRAASRQRMNVVGEALAKRLARLIRGGL